MKNALLSKKHPNYIIISTLILALLTGCGSSSSDASPMYKAAAGNPMVAEDVSYDYEDGFAEEAIEAEYDTAANAEAESPEVGGADARTGRKLITRMNIEAETEDIEALVGKIEDKAAAIGGYIESSSVYNSTPYYGTDGTRREADLTARVPADRLDEFIAALEGSSNITARSRNVEDVTLNYVDTQAHKEALDAERESLLKLMDNAKSVEDIMAIETRLTDVRYQLESIERQLRSYDNQIDYSTVYINLIETKSFTPQESATIADRISKGFKESLYSVSRGSVDFVVYFVTHLPQLIIFIAALLIIILIVKSIISLIRKRSGGRKSRIKNEASKKRKDSAEYTPYEDKEIGEQEKNDREQHE